MRNTRYLKRGAAGALCLLVGFTALSAEPTTEPELQWKLYGFLRSHYAAADNAVLSWGTESLTQPNSAKRATQVDDRSPRSQLIFQESRFGIAPTSGDFVEGVFEFDLANDNAATGIRARKAAVEFKISPSARLFIGKTGDIFSPLGPSLYNISYLLQQGNVGDRREQAGFSMRLSDAVTFKAALGNTSSSNAQLSTMNGTPSVSFQLKFAPTGSMHFYLSGITANIKHGHALIDPDYADSLNRLPLDPATDLTPYVTPYLQHGGKPVRRESNAIALGADLKIGEKVKIVAEGYYGTNMAHLGIAGLDAGSVQIRTQKAAMKNQFLGYVTETGDPTANAFLNTVNSSTILQFRSIKEAGGFLSVVVGFGSSWELQAFGGGAKVLNPNDLNSADPAVLSKWQGPTSTASPGAAKENRSLGWNVGWKPGGLQSVTIFLEHQYFDTLYHDGESVTTYRNIKGVDLTQANPITEKAASDVIPDEGLPAYRAVANTLRFGAHFSF